MKPNKFSEEQRLTRKTSLCSVVEGISALNFKSVINKPSTNKRYQVFENSSDEKGITGIEPNFEI